MTHALDCGADPLHEHPSDASATTVWQVAAVEDDPIEYGELARTSWWHERYTVLLTIGITLGLTAIVIPYREVNIPPIIMLMGAMFVGLLCLKFALEDYTYLMLMFAIYAPFQKVLPGDFGSFLRTFNITNIMILLMMFGWFSQGITTGRKLLTVRWVDLFVFLFMFMSTIALIRGYYYYGIEMERGEHLIFPLKRWLEPMLIYFLFVNNLTDRATMRKLTLAAFIAILCCALICLKEFYLDKNGLYDDFSSLDRMRIVGIADQSNQMAAFFCYYGFFILSFFLCYLNVPIYWSLWFVFVLCYQSMHLCFSRGGQLGFLAGGIMTLWFWSKRVFFLCVAPLLIIGIMQPDLIPARFVGRLGHTIVAPTDEFSADSGRTQLDPTANERLVIWSAAVLMIYDYPMFGVGYGRFKKRIGDYNPEKATKDVHSTYLGIAAEMGIPTLIIFLIMISLGAYHAWKVYRHTQIRYFRAMSIGYLGGFFAFLVTNVFGSRLDSNEISFYYWIFTAIMVRMSEMTMVEVERRAAFENQRHDQLAAL